MIQILIEQKLLTGIILLLLLLSIICQIIIGVICQNLIREVENISITKNKQLKQCKLKFANCYQLNKGIPNISAFVDKFISRLQAAHLSLNSFHHLAGQFMMLSVVMAGVGVCRAIIAGETLIRILPYYFLSMLDLYIYFSVSGIVDFQGRKNVLKINLVDYLENHMLNRLENSLIGDMNAPDKANSREIRKPREVKRVMDTVEIRETTGLQGVFPAAGQAPLRDEIPAEGQGYPSIQEQSLIPAAESAKAAFSEEELEDLLKELLV